MKMANVMRGLAVATLFASLGPIACGSDSGSSGSDKNTQTGTGGSKSTADSGTPATTPTTMPSSAVPAGSVGCGSNVCEMRADLTGAPCCLDMFSGTCGYKNALMQCVQAPPPPPPGCPMLPTVPFVTLTSCCTSKGECGIDESMLGMGCINYADASALGQMFMGGAMGAAGAAGMGFNFNITLPAEASCTPADGGT